MYFKIFRTQSWGKKTGQDKTGVFRGALQFKVLGRAVGTVGQGPVPVFAFWVKI